MKAIVYDYRRAEVLHREELPLPTCGPEEVLVRVRAAAFNALDRYRFPLRSFTGRLRSRHGRPGSDFAGEVSAVGASVRDFRMGDAVFGAVRGALAEYVTIRADRIARKPSRATFEQTAALTIAGLTALQALRDVARMQRGQRVLVIGAAGGVGSFAVQVAKALGGVVTGVTSTGRLDAVVSLGADHVLDYTRDDYLSGQLLYDVIVDCGGYRSLRDCRRALAPRGTYVGIGANLKAVWTLIPRLIALASVYRFSAKKMRFFIARVCTPDLGVLRDMVDAGTLHPLVPRVYAFDETLDAMRDFQSGRTFGKVVVSVP